MKYKLIKTYPGSPVLGFITIPKRSDNDYYVNSNWIYPEKYPEFWEKVVELNCEILKSCPIGGGIYSVKRVSDGEIFTVGDTIANMCDSEQKISKLYINKNTGEMCVYTSTTCRFTIHSIKKVKKVVKLDYEIVKSCPIEGSIYSIKRLSDSEVFTLGDIIDFNGMGNGVLIKIDFERAPIDKGTGRLCFVGDNSLLGDWWNIKDLSRLKKPVFMTKDNVTLVGGEKVHIVTKDLTLGVGLNFTVADLKDSNCLFFAEKENAEKYIQDNRPKRLYTEDEMERALENWGMCKVNISYVNDFLNK